MAHSREPVRTETYLVSVADLAKPDPNQSNSPEISDGLPLTPLQRLVANALNRGLNQKQITTLISKRTGVSRQKARGQYKRCIKSAAFRDHLWDKVLIDLDAAAPAIVNGVAKRAAKGRVDAAKFALELAGRYDPRPDSQVNVPVTVVLGQIPRPQRANKPELVEGEVTEEEEL